MQDTKNLTLIYTPNSVYISVKSFVTCMFVGAVVYLTGDSKENG